jgi:hypothetical protein
MHFSAFLSRKNSPILSVLSKLKTAITNKEVWRPIDEFSFVFLCGANIKEKLISKRRELLIKFSKKQLPKTKFFIAEAIFDVLKKEGCKPPVISAIEL